MGHKKLMKSVLKGNFIYLANYWACELEQPCDKKLKQGGNFGFLKKLNSIDCINKYKHETKRTIIGLQKNLVVYILLCIFLKKRDSIECVSSYNHET